LFAAPPEKDMDWSDQGIEGAFRFLKRLWRIVVDFKDNIKSATAKNENVPQFMEDLKRKTHQTIQKVTEDIDQRFRFNTAIAAMMELVNEIYKIKDDVKQPQETSVVKEAIEALIVMLSPFVPHIADELWEMLGYDGMLLNHPWPAYDPSWAEKKMVTIAVQVNGKVRAKIPMLADSQELEVERIAMEDQNVKKFTEEGSVVKVIHVKNRIVNIIVKS
jgi:leucyl-tRNA synthetase